MELFSGHTNTHTHRWTDKRGSQNSYLDGFHREDTKSVGRTFCVGRTLLPKLGKISHAKKKAYFLSDLAANDFINSGMTQEFQICAQILDRSMGSG